MFAIAAFVPLMAAQPNEDPDALEQSIKAVFLYKFTDYIEWPQILFLNLPIQLPSPIIGDDQLAAMLSELAASRRVNGRTVAVRKLMGINSDSTVQVLFIGNNDKDKDRLSALASSLDDRPILIVTESRGALSEGSVINFRLIDGHVRFEIALDASQKRGLKLSSPLFAVAQSVQTGSR